MTGHASGSAKSTDAACGGQSAGNDVRRGAPDVSIRGRSDSPAGRRSRVGASCAAHPAAARLPAAHHAHAASISCRATPGALPIGDAPGRYVWLAA
ncbi:hypothetical protein WJ28_06785 [Burkholderia thailandensis]|nr:hypothetical protein WJ27_16380 [Burkholderia thailandensis]KVG12150.1 hypothetical protein WJ25_08120 [Burkholderia thailandensis]KVG18627.1 hypothetical protein WJ28_06785 [Burkholderia thailandensis]